MRRHWIVFERSTEASRSIRNLANTVGFGDFCRNLKIDVKDEKSTNVFASDWLADLGHALKCRTAVAVSRLIQQGGLDQLPSGYKQFIQEHPIAFAPILR
jgi:hypothetical protein